MKSAIKTLSCLGFVTLLVFVSSCGDDDNNSCNEIYGKIGTATGGLLSSDCEEVVEAYDKLIDLYDEGRDCKVIKEEIEDEGYDSVDDFLAQLQETRDEVEADCNP